MHITIEEIKSLCIWTGYAGLGAPSYRSFNDEEARHILYLLSNRGAKTIYLKRGFTNGSDGETWSYFRIQKLNGRDPMQIRKKVRYVYKAPIYLGWIDENPLSRKLEAAFEAAGVQYLPGPSVAT